MFIPWYHIGLIDAASNLAFGESKFLLIPKRLKRDGRTATEQPTSNYNSTERIDRDKKHQRRLQDSVLLGSRSVTGSKIDNVSLSKDSDKKNNGYREGTKHSSDNITAPRPRSHIQGSSKKQPKTPNRTSIRRGVRPHIRLTSRMTKKKPSSTPHRNRLDQRVEIQQNGFPLRVDNNRSR
ncbi:hypothetical protein R6Q57_013483 [Mikania cordata]